MLGLEAKSRSTHNTNHQPNAPFALGFADLATKKREDGAPHAKLFENVVPDSYYQIHVGLTYFKRFRMECDLREALLDPRPVPIGYELVAFRPDLVREHAAAKYESFRNELDVNVFPCLGRRDGCLRLMREISSRATFVPEATWLLRFRDERGSMVPIGTVQGLELEGWGAIQNLGIATAHRGKGLGTILLMKAAAGFYNAGLKRIHLEVTTENTAAIRLYERLGFKQAQVVYKAAEVAGI